MAYKDNCPDCETFQAALQRARYPFVWCDNCKAIREYHSPDMPAGENNPHAATDIVCKECAWVVATFHEKRVADSEEE